VLCRTAVANEIFDHAAIARQEGNGNALDGRDLLRRLGLGVLEEGTLVGSPAAAETGLQGAVLDFERTAEERQAPAFDEGIDVAKLVGQALDEQLGPERAVDKVEKLLGHGAQDVHRRAKGNRANAANEQRVGSQRRKHALDRHRRPSRSRRRVD
jgi:hypothetical protein